MISHHYSIDIYLAKVVFWGLSNKHPALWKFWYAHWEKWLVYTMHFSQNSVQTLLLAILHPQRVLLPLQTSFCNDGLREELMNNNGRIFLTSLRWGRKQRIGISSWIWREGILLQGRRNGWRVYLISLSNS